MKKITRPDIQNLYEYEKEREAFRKHVMALKRHRRMAVGDRLSFLFENRDTVRFQIQEMIRAERIVDERQIEAEIEVYNQLLPDADELSATMFIEITERNEIKPELDRFQGLDRGDNVYLELGNRARIFAAFEAGHSQEDRISAVHYLRFKFSAQQRNWFQQPDLPVALVVRHPHYCARALLRFDQRATLAADFEETPLAVGSGTEQ